MTYCLFDGGSLLNSFYDSSIGEKMMDAAYCMAEQGTIDEYRAYDMASDYLKELLLNESLFGVNTNRSQKIAYLTDHLSPPLQNNAVGLIHSESRFSDSIDEQTIKILLAVADARQNEQDRKQIYHRILSGYECGIKSGVIYSSECLLQIADIYSQQGDNENAHRIIDTLKVDDAVSANPYQMAYVLQKDCLIYEEENNLKQASQVMISAGQILIDTIKGQLLNYSQISSIVYYLSGAVNLVLRILDTGQKPEKLRLIYVIKQLYSISFFKSDKPLIFHENDCRDKQLLVAIACGFLKIGACFESSPDIMQTFFIYAIDILQNNTNNLILAYADKLCLETSLAYDGYLEKRGLKSVGVNETIEKYAKENKIPYGIAKYFIKTAARKSLKKTINKLKKLK